jgi:hypothetical protein
MKTFKKILLVAFVAIFSFACGKDDPTPTAHNETKTHTWTVPIQGYANQAISSTLTIALKDVLGETDANNFTSGTFQRLTGNAIAVTSSKTLPLTNVTLKVDNNTYTITDFNNTAGEEALNFLSKIFSAYTSKSKTATVTVSFTPSANIDPADNAKLTLSIVGQYKWNTFEK